MTAGGAIMLLGSLAFFVQAFFAPSPWLNVAFGVIYLLGGADLLTARWRASRKDRREAARH